MRIAVLAAAVFAPMIVEALIARRHDQALRSAGAVEPAGDVFAAMQVAYPAAFAAMLLEGWMRHVPPDRLLVAGGCVFAAAKGLKYWAIATLGRRWTFRVLVPPGSTRIVSGPYRFLRHPNYVAVTGELAGVALMSPALIAGPLATVAFVMLMLRRIAVEERALASPFVPQTREGIASSEEGRRER